MSIFTKKVAAVTGAGSGIGRALALKLADYGAYLALSDIDEDKVAQTRDLIQEKGGKAFSQKVDVASMEEVQAWVKAFETELGPTDYLFNNAGVTVVDQVISQSLEDMHWLMDINFWGVVHGVKAVLPGMRERGKGHIVNLSSVFGIIAVPSQSAYNASKFAVRGFSEALIHEEARHGIRVSCVHPGGIQTDIAVNARYRRNHRGHTDKDKFVALFSKKAKTTAEQAAEVILKGVKDNKPRILIGNDARFLDKLQRLFPVSYRWVLKKMGAI